MRQINKPLDELTLEIYRLLENTNSMGVQNSPMTRLVEFDLRQLLYKYKTMNSVMGSIERRRGLIDD